MRHDEDPEFHPDRERVALPAMPRKKACVAPEMDASSIRSQICFGLRLPGALVKQHEGGHAGEDGGPFCADS